MIDIDSKLEAITKKYHKIEKKLLNQNIITIFENVILYIIFL